MGGRRLIGGEFLGVQEKAGQQDLPDRVEHDGGAEAVADDHELVLAVRSRLDRPLQPHQELDQGAPADLVTRVLPVPERCVLDDGNRPGSAPPADVDADDVLAGVVVDVLKVVEGTLEVSHVEIVGRRIVEPAMHEDDYVLWLLARTDDRESPLDLGAILEGSLLVDLDVGHGDAKRRWGRELRTEGRIRHELLGGLLALTIRPLGGAPGASQNEEDAEAERPSQRHEVSLAIHRYPLLASPHWYREIADAILPQSRQACTF